MSLSFRPLFNAAASSSRLVSRRDCRRCLHTSLQNLEISESNRSTPNHREVIEKQRKAFEEKYGDKLKQKAKEEGVRDVSALKVKVMAPSIKRALLAKQSAKDYSEKKTKAPETSETGHTTQSTSSHKARTEQAKGDRAGIKPLGSILNLDILQNKTHTADDISKIWTAHHTTHPSLSASFLSAFLSSSTYNSMLKLAMENPFFVLPLPLEGPKGAGTEIKVGEYEMFYLQWLFHPTLSPTVKPSVTTEERPDRPPYTSSVIFTPLEEFKKAGEWAQPHLVITHYPELANSHDLVLMRGEISSASETGPQGSVLNPRYLLSQQRAQLLALALQRFYCASIDSLKESPDDRAKRIQTLRDFREKPAEWNWQGLVDMAYSGLL